LRISPLRNDSPPQERIPFTFHDEAPQWRNWGRNEKKLFCEITIRVVVSFLQCFVHSLSDEKNEEGIGTN